MRIQAIALSCLVAATACRSQVPAADIVARVNGEAISKKAFEEVVARNLKRYGDQRQTLPEGVVARIQEGVLHGLIDERIVAQRAEQEGIEVTTAELDEKLGQHRARFRNKEAYDDYLARSNNTEAVLKEELRKSLLRDRLVDKVGGPVEVDADQVRRYYEENPEHFVEMEQMRVHRLFLAYPKDASAGAQRKVKRRAEELRARVHHERHSAESFAKLCAKHSEAPEASREGDLGLVVAGRMPELDRALSQGLVVGELSDVMETPHGVAVFRLDEHRPKHRRPLAEVEGAIRTTLLLHLRNEHRQNVLRDIKADAKVQTLVTFEVRPQSPQMPPSAAPNPGGAKPPASPVAPRQEVGTRPAALSSTPPTGLG